MLASLTYRREDGTFVGVVNGHPYHVIPDDPLFAEAQAIAAGLAIGAYQRAARALTA